MKIISNDKYNEYLMLKKMYARLQKDNYFKFTKKQIKDILRRKINSEVFGNDSASFSNMLDRLIEQTYFEFLCEGKIAMISIYSFEEE